MEELRNKLSKKFEHKPRKVRFRISSSYSGRVLKQVYEDGSESEEPDDEGPCGSLKTQLSEGFEIGRTGVQERWDPSYPSSTRLLAQRINVFRDGGRYSMTGGQNSFTELTATRSKEGEPEPTCLQCKGAGCVPCSLCHGSKLSMFANRFKESFRAIRCPGCNENGVQPCQTCAH
ncbi:glutaredoxin domain-containing cysteine-rich protein 2 [Heterodontus francisci]|uniref:glutaredoxin domain-containing cysteine-rich protein 2 n=1 Tax=Heterodontus francisci TaxID=7792 RepID=UPI00355B5A51